MANHRSRVNWDEIAIGFIYLVLVVLIVMGIMALIVLAARAVF